MSNVINITLHKMRELIEDEMSRWGKGKKVQWLMRTSSRLTAYLYTANHRYCLSLHEPGDDDEGYLGCTVSTRAPRPGEDHTRGNDLHDGKFTVETWQNIKGDILAYELQAVVEPSTPQDGVVVADAVVENPVIESVGRGRLDTQIEEEEIKSLALALPRIWGVTSDDADKTIDPGMHFSRACGCGTCVRNDPEHVVGYLRFLPQGSGKGVTLFVYDREVYDLIETAIQQLPDCTIAETSGNLAIPAQPM